MEKAVFTELISAKGVTSKTQISSTNLGCLWSNLKKNQKKKNFLI
jgi:hypothetical protein